MQSEKPTNRLDSDSASRRFFDNENELGLGLRPVDCDRNVSLQSLFVSARGSHTSSIGSKSVENIELEGFIQITDNDDVANDDDEEKTFKEYEREYYLHSLALTGNTDQLEVELNNVKDMDSLTSKDKNGRTLLHCAVIFHGNTQKCVQIILAKLKDLIQVEIKDRAQWNVYYANFVNSKDCNSITPLYIAAKYENFKMCKELLLNNADWDIKSNRSKSPILKMFKKTPLLIKKTLLKFAAQNTCYKNKEETIVQIDFGSIIGYPSEDETQKNSTWIYEETHLLSNLCYTKESDRKFILGHILVKIFIWLKWKKFKYWFWLIVVLPILRLLLYFWFIIRVYRKDCPYPTNQQIEFTWGGLRPAIEFNLTDRNSTDTYQHCYSKAVVTYWGWFLLIGSTVDLLFFDVYPSYINFHRHFYPLKSRTVKKYIKRSFLFVKIIGVRKYVEFSAIILNVLPALGAPIIFPGSEAQYIIASVGVFLAWFHIFYQLGRIPQLKVYVDMFAKVLVTLIDVSFMYGAIIFAFAMVFCILLPGIGSYSSLSQALLKMATFLIGEIEYETLFYSEESSEISASLKTTMIFYVVAIIVLHVALLNFLVGLTVSDIQTMHDDKETLQNFCKVWQMSLIETFWSGAPSSWGVPLLKFMRVQTGRKIFDEDGFIIQLHLNRIPKEFQKELRKLLAKQKLKKVEKSKLVTT